MAELAGISKNIAIRNPPKAKSKPHNDDQTITPRRLFAWNVAISAGSRRRASSNNAPIIFIAIATVKAVSKTIA